MNLFPNAVTYVFQPSCIRLLPIATVCVAWHFSLRYRFCKSFGLSFMAPAHAVTSCGLVGAFCWQSLISFVMLWRLRKSVLAEMVTTVAVVELVTANAKQSGCRC